MTLNAIDPNRIRSVDRKTFDAMSRHTKTQASREGSVPDFGFDVEQDLLRAVTGTPVDQQLGKRLTGMDALVTSVALRLEDVPAQLDRYLRQFHDETYRTRFPWVDQVSEVKDPSRRQELDSELVDMLNTGKLERAWLSVPDIIEWAEVMGFRYGKRVRADVHPDLHIRTFLAEVGSPIGLEQLLTTQIFSINAAGEYVSGKWRAYDCLYCEIDSGDTTYLLNGGKWYAIRNDFVEEVNASVEAIPACSLPLPPYQDASEGRYAERVFGSDTEQFALMDGENIPYGGGASKVEFCDLYTLRRHLIHLKRYGGSSVLSHLFAQGVVSATAWLSDAQFRAAVNKRLPTSHRIESVKEKPRAEDFEIVFGIISKSSRRLVLPFFSRVNLRNAYRQLRAYGFKVSVAKILARAAADTLAA